MAKVKMPLLSQNASASVGDLVFYRRGDFGINVARIKVKPSNPKTENQMAVRNNLKTLSGIYSGRVSPAGAVLYKHTASGWQSITIANNETFTQADRQSWDTYIHTSKQGHKVKERLAFIGVNMDRLLAGENPLKRPNTSFNVG